MAAEKHSAMGLLLRDLFRADIYKRSQGRIARQVTFVAMALFVLAGVWTLNSQWYDASWLSVPGRYALNSALAVAGLWICYRIVNFSRFADFLISVEVEMGKVSWPSRKQLTRSSAVVLVTIFGMSAMMYLYDFIWDRLLTLLQVL